jgi:hypothetical protein
MRIRRLLGLTITIILGLAVGCPPSSTDDDDATSGDDDDATLDPQELVGRTYLLHLTNGGFVYTEPADIGPIAAMMWTADDANVFSPIVLDPVAGTVEFMNGSAHTADAAADPVIWTQGDLQTRNAAGSWDDFAFEGGPIDLVFDLDGDPFTLVDVVFGGTFSADGTLIEDAYVRATVDLAPYDVFMELEPGTLCELLEEQTDAACGDCPPSVSAEGPTCLDIAAEQGECPQVEGLDMVQVD